MVNVTVDDQIEVDVGEAEEAGAGFGQSMPTRFYSQLASISSKDYDERCYCLLLSIDWILTC